MGISSSADFADDLDEPELMSQVIAPARPRTPSPSLHSGPPPAYDSVTKKVLDVGIMIVLRRLTIVFRFSSTLTFDGFKKAK